MKWKDLSHLHVSWERLEDLMNNEEASRVKPRLTTFRRHVAAALGDEEDLYVVLFPRVGCSRRAVRPRLCCVHRCRFNPEYAVPERVIGHREDDASDTDTNGGSADASGRQYFVKWTGLPYSECTWEVRIDSAFSRTTRLQ